MKRHLREVLAASRAQAVFTAIVVLMMAISVAGVVLTVGRSEGAAAEIARRVDGQMPRVITLRPTAEQGRMTSRLVAAIARIDSVESVVGLGASQDLRLIGLPHGAPIAGQRVYGTLPGAEPVASGLVTVHLTDHSRRVLGMTTAGGVLIADSGEEFMLDPRSLLLPEYLADREPLGVVPQPLSGDEQVQEIVVLCSSVSEVPEVAAILATMANHDEPGSVAVSLDEDLVTLQQALAGDLTRQGRIILMGALAGVAVILLVTVFGFLFSRRRDLGRRRVLGASRRQLIVLTVGQVVVASLGGVLLGVVAGLVGLAVSGNPLPRPGFVALLAVALVSLVTLVAAVPAWFAARLDPVRALRAS